ncbi:MAG: hypothetical protein ACO37G_02540 [Candidatus Nanopelagicaceae bacterium]
MSEELDLKGIKSRWNEILDQLERTDRVAWLAYFDGRLVSYQSGVLTMDFSDPNKIPGGHDYSQVRHERFRPALEETLKVIFGFQIAITEIR